MMKLLTRAIRAWWSFVALVCSNFVSLVGSTLTTVSALGFLAFILYDANHPFHQPYIGIFTYLIVPGIFFFGLLLIPLGLWWERRRAAGHRFPGEAGYPRIDFGNPSHRRRFVTFGVLTCANLVLFGSMSYEGVEYMDSNSFCGTVCHSVMKPEYTATQDSPHSRTKCVQCHIGPGAGMFVRYKLSGLRQVYRVNFGGFARPIPSPVRNLRPSRDTCEQCHWPDKFHGDRLWVRDQYHTDESNTKLTTALMLKLGGPLADGGRGAGIHRHVSGRNRIVYIATDDKRQVIPWVQVRRPDGSDEVFVSAEGVPEGTTPERLAAEGKAERRELDCVDCHNRPTHTFHLPGRALDLAIDRGEVDASLPFVKKTGLDLLRKEYVADRDAEEGIRGGLRAFYAGKYPDLARAKSAEIDRSAAGILGAWRRNVFPEMKITWGTYPSNLGHEDFPGCFRCHDEKHQSKSGKVISQDCEICHQILAQEEEHLDLEKRFEGK